MSKQVLCYGEVLWDTIGHEKKAGGAPMNVALNLLKQGIDVSMVSRVGADDLGDELINFLKKNNLYSDLVQTDVDLPTCKVLVELDANHQATYIIPKPVSWDNILPEEPLLKKMETADVIVFGSLACRNATSRDTLLNLFEKKLLKIFDVNLRAPHYELSTIETLAAYTDVIKMNEDEATLLIGGSDAPLQDQIIEFQKKFHCQTICVTRGEHGAIIWHDEKFYEHPGFTVQVQDTIGAGDAFLATFVAGLLNNQPADKILEKACAIGAFVASKGGANPEYDEAEIRQIANNLSTGQDQINIIT